ncbi:MAG TPA: hypothetical protein VN181_07295 [Thermoanaerobaculia bacterium]|nr:hypothetical protein [Thermoanaerobaculia bacterium]
MPCDHMGPHDLIAMAEKQLRERGVAEDAWNGLTFRWSENPPDGMWKSIVLEVERRRDEWVVTRIDRNPDALDEDELGFREV